MLRNGKSPVKHPVKRLLRIGWRMPDEDWGLPNFEIKNAIIMLNTIATKLIPVPHPGDSSRTDVEWFDIEFYVEYIGKVATLHNVPSNRVDAVSEQFKEYLNA